ncbi:MAG: molybdopterin-binding protein [Gammaproteobacteria bacterium]|jgi:molybdopterin-biosynthesis enzyme MoeA-like protein|nr:molybdopterin-binding protein [Gammaproteobacteria bacterium]MDH3934124.1 molybdopterin-binding protein [Gammaproteobacteria bacterium]MDH3972265.1 molybdopterin-binding protein [Gammaproteobacteria bacterium]
MNKARHFGVMIVGDELLSGKRTDKHLSHVIETLHARGMSVAWSRMVSDNHNRLVHELKLTQLDSVPVFCFGGIGATPDDQTRQAAAGAFGMRLLRHPDAVSMIEDRFGREAYPNRVRMADLPEDCLLIPNPHSRIPGFTVFDHHFFPGFPSLAWTMLDWVLDSYYGHDLQPEVEKSVRVFDTHESALIQLLDELSAGHPRAKIFSLPHMAAVASIELGFRGEAAAVEVAFSALQAALKTAAVKFENLDARAAASVLRQAVV